VDLTDKRSRHAARSAVTCVYVPESAPWYVFPVIKDVPNNDDLERTLNPKRRLGGRARMDLLGHTVLLVEDDFCQARDAQQALQHAGAKVVGPFADSESALLSIAVRDPSCAIVDIRLSDGGAFGVAAALVAKGVPTMFLTGPDLSAIPKELAGVPVLQKPVDYRLLISLAAQISSKRWA
jgi:CheY-like chemotaxis protein